MNILTRYLFIFMLPFVVFAQGELQKSNFSNKHSNIVSRQTMQREMTVTLIELMSNTIHSLQKERGASTGFISSNGVEFQSRLKDTKLASDTSKQKLLSYLNLNSKLLQEYYSKSRQKSLNNLFGNLFTLRKNVANLNINFAKTYSKYTQIIGVLLLNISDISDHFKNKELINKLYNYSTLLLYKESIGQKRAALSGLFSQKKFSKEIFEYFLTADTQEKIYLKTFLRNTNEQTRQLYHKLLSAKNTKKVQYYEKLALKKLQGKDVNVNPEKWFESITKKINLIQKVEYRVIDDIKKLIQKLDKSSAINFSQKEQEWLATKPLIKYAYDPSWKPFEWKNGISQHVGIVADIIKIIGKTGGIRFVASPSNTWNEALGKIKNGSVDMMSAMARTKDREQYANFTKNVIFTIPNVFVSKKSSNYKKGFADLKDKKVAVIGGYAIESLLKRDKPNIPLVSVNNVIDGLRGLVDGKIDVLIINMATAEYYLNNVKFKNLKISFKTHYNFDLRMAFRKGYPKVALSVIDKVIDTISNEERNRVYNKWTQQTNSSKIDTTSLSKDISISDLFPIKEMIFVTIIFLIITVFIFKYLNRREDINIGVPIFIFGIIFSIVTIFIMVISVTNLERVKKKELRDALVTILNSTQVALQEWYYNKKDSIEYIVHNSPYLYNIKLLTTHKNSIKFLKENQQNIEQYYKSTKKTFKDRDSYFIVSKDDTILGSSTKELIGTKITLPFVTKEIQYAFDGNYAFIHPKIDKQDKYGLFTKLYFLTPIYDKETDQIIAVYATGITPASMIRILNVERMGKTGETYIINKRAQLISNSRFDDELRKIGLIKKNQHSFLNIKIMYKSKPTLAAASVLKKHSGYSISSYKDYRGIDVFGAWLWDKNLHFGIITEIDVKEAMSSFDKLKQTIYLSIFSIIGFVILLMLFLVWFANRNRKTLELKNMELKELTTQQTKQLQITERSNRLLSGRENRMVELKNEINEYANKLGIQKPYPIVDTLEENLSTNLETDSNKKIDIKDLLDIPKLQLLMEEFYSFMHVPLAIIDTEGNILVQSKWSIACTDFHRANSESCKRCIESDTDISHKLEDGENFSVYKCKNGLIDCASPIIIKGKHVANFFIGQFLIHDPDIDFFTNQAKIFKYNTSDYVRAIKDVVVLSEDKLPHILGFLKEITEIIVTLSNEKFNYQEQQLEMKKANIASMNLAEDAQQAKIEIERYKNHLEDLVENRTQELAKEKQFTQTLLDSQEQIIITTDGATLKSVNKTFLDFFAVTSKEEFAKKYNSKCICETFDTKYPNIYLQTKVDDEMWIDYIISHQNQTHKVMIQRGGIDYIFSATATKLPGENNLKSAVFTNITEIENAKKKIEQMHRHTQDSIKYASFIQGALIPDNQLFKHYYSDYFAIWHPKDIVGGDIYLFEELRDKNECLLMVIDCTGHGVPGAFVTMLVKAIERQVVAKINSDAKIDVSPAWILSYFNRKMKQLLKQEDRDSISNAGFDGGIIYYNKKEKIIKYSGAETPLFYLDNTELKTIKGSRHSVGYKTSNVLFEFQEHKITVQKGMQFYLSTDGYFDQNGGEKGFPFSKRRFKDIINKYRNESMADQQEMFLNILNDYQGYEDTNDDITIVGFKI